MDYSCLHLDFNLHFVTAIGSPRSVDALRPPVQVLLDFDSPLARM